MMTPLPIDDDQLLKELGAALRSAGPITGAELAQARGAFTWRTVDEELAALVFDSSIHERSSMRGEVFAGGRTLIFEGNTVSVEVDATPDALTGRVVPPGRADISLITCHGTAEETTTDDMGSFVLSPAPSGPMRLLCRTPTAHLVTDWVRL